MIGVARIEPHQSDSGFRTRSGAIFIAPGKRAGILLGNARKQVSAVPS